MVGAHALAWPQWVALLATAATATLLRVAALAVGYTLPTWRGGR